MSYQELKQFLDFEKAIPVTDKWSAAPDVLKIVSEYCLENKPVTIVECSSGTSSIILSKCCQLNKSGRVYSLENGDEYVKKTVEWLDDFSLSENCDVITAPLKNYTLAGNDYQWYDLKNFTVEKIDLLLIDGPPGFIQKNSRYPALPLLEPFLSENCVIFLDDAARDDEREVVSLWLNMFPEFHHEYIDTERGCSILKR